MKVKIISKIFAAIFCSIVFVSEIHAQEKPKSFLIDEITDSDTKNFQIVEQKIEKFISRLIKEPLETKGYIEIPENTEIGKQIKSQIDKNADVKTHISFWGKLKHPEYYRSGFGVGLYIIPLNAEIPDMCILETCVCPNLIIETSISKENNNPILIYELKASGGNIEITYHWKVSAGEIVEGQNTPVIKVDAKAAKEITATVELGGLCEECVHEASFTSKIEEKLDLIAVVGRSADEPVKMNLEILLSILKNDPTKRAYIINYGSVKGGRRDFARRKWVIVQYFSLIKADISRITLMDGGNHKEETTEIWISPDDKQKPVPTPTVDAKFVGVPAAPKKSGRRKSE